MTDERRPHANIKLHVTQDEADMLLRGLEALQYREMDSLALDYFRSAIAIPNPQIQGQIIQRMYQVLSNLKEEQGGLWDDITLTRASLIKAKRAAIGKWLSIKPKEKDDGSSQAKESKQGKEEKEKGNEEETEVIFLDPYDLLEDGDEDGRVPPRNN